MKMYLAVFALILTGCRMPATQGEQTQSPSREVGHQIPGLQDGAIPQGLAYLPDHNLLLISYYHTDGRPSVIRSMDWKTGEVKHSTELREMDSAPHCGHVGGIAADAVNLWIASDAYLYHYDLNDILEHDQAVATAAYKTEATEEVAFCAVHNELIWAGEFALKNKYPTDPAHHLIDRTGASRGGWVSAHASDALQSTREPARASHALSIPDKTQGIHFMDEHIILSRSYGRRGWSVIEVYKHPLSEEPHQIAPTSSGEDVPLWFLDGSNLLHAIALPPMTENIEMIDGQLVILFESGTKKYRKFGRDPQDHFMILNLNEWL